MAAVSPVHLSFSACGFLGVYHLGVARALLTLGPGLLRVVQEFAGASAGAMVAALLLTAPERIEDALHVVLSLAEDSRRHSLGPATPGFQLTARLRSSLDALLPPDAHLQAHGRLHITLTHARTWRAHRVCSYPCRESLLTVLSASSFIPVYSGLRPVMYQGEPWVDGGFSDSLPVLPNGRTITVSPFRGRQDVCPGGPGPSGGPCVRLGGQELEVQVPELHHGEDSPGQRLKDPGTEEMMDRPGCPEEGKSHPQGDGQAFIYKHRKSRPPWWTDLYV